jgi:hypothetical protein
MLHVALRDAQVETEEERREVVQSKVDSMKDW